jgi:hypothetical protein
MAMMSIRDVSLFVKVMGHGHPLVLMHGGPSEDYTTLLSLEPLADRFTLSGAFGALWSVLSTALVLSGRQE